MSCLSSLRLVADIGRWGLAGGAPAMSWDDMPTPESPSAATIAMPSGLISTPLWPIACAAISAAPEAVEADPEKAGTPRCQVEPMPKPRSVPVSWIEVRVLDRVANAVPQPEA